MYDSVYFSGEYEPAISKIVRNIVKPGHVCFDVGANWGWYTTLLAKLCSPEGRVHSFEPVPFIYNGLTKNVRLSGFEAICSLNNTAVGKKRQKSHIHIFKEMPDGHSSLSKHLRIQENGYETIDCTIISVDEYLWEHSIKQVDFIKCDVEGAELWTIQGATRLFSQKVPPVWIIEVATETLAGFGYRHNDVLDQMRALAPYSFYVIDEQRGWLRQMERFGQEDLGANVLCIPDEMSQKGYLGSLKI
jgi:FkbM family methyltransferase